MNILNLNIGVLGHVDSGKTSLVKVLSSTTSTACFDKNPQSQERGITIDLGFSSFLIDFPPCLFGEGIETYEKLQYTFVDCPGHASLIKTIIGGAQIIDIMILVVDVTKGIQTQTAECLVIGEILRPKMVVALNKIDQIEEKKQAHVMEKMTKRMKLTLADTVFKDCPIVCVAAKPASGEAVGVDRLLSALLEVARVPQRRPDLSAVLSVDHCFGIRGQGTVMTGTMLQGTITVNDMLEIPALGMAKKVKSLQIFRRNVERARAGDRVAVCMTQFEPKLLERGLACAPGHVGQAYAAIATLDKVRYYRHPITSRTKYHITVGHYTVLGKLTIFSAPDSDSFNINRDYIYRETYEGPAQNGGSGEESCDTSHFALIEFESPIFIVPDSVFIGSKLDMDTHTSSCRIAFFGKFVEMFTDKNYASSTLPKLKVYKDKSKAGVIDRIVNEQEVICRNMFKKETKLELFTGLNVELSTGEKGIVEGSFGQSGKIRLRIPEGLGSEAMSNAALKKSKKGKDAEESHAGNREIQVHLKFRKYIFSTSKAIVQNSKA